MQKRRFLTVSARSFGLLCAAQSWVSQTFAQGLALWNKPAFEAKSLADVVKSLGGAGPAIESTDIVLQAPEIAADGSLVRITAQSNIAGTSQISVMVEKNPHALAASFDIPADVDASISTTIKMAQSSNVYVLARAGDRFYYSVSDVRVTLGGCGA